MTSKELKLNERNLVVRLTEGDEGAFCELYANYKERLLSFVLKFLKSKEYAEDIFHDVFTSIWQNRRFIDPNEPFSSYLYTITRNRVLNQLRDLSYDDKLKAHILSGAIDYNNETHEYILADDLKNLIVEATKKLTPRQLEVFQMSREGEKSYREIAQALNISINTVQEHISASLKIIRDYLSKYSDVSTDLILILLWLNIVR